MDGCGIARLPSMLSVGSYRQAPVVVLDADGRLSRSGLMLIARYPHESGGRNIWRDLRGLPGHAVNYSGSGRCSPVKEARVSGGTPYQRIAARTSGDAVESIIGHYRAFMSGRNKRNFSTPHLIIA